VNNFEFYDATEATVALALEFISLLPGVQDVVFKVQTVVLS